MTFWVKRCIISEKESRGDPAEYIFEAKKMLARQFFYDHFTPEDICGMFTPGHFLSILLFFGTLGLALWLSRRMDSKVVRKVHIGVAIGVTVMEIIKISLRFYKGQGPDDWMPLYFCSLFLFAVWLALAKPGFLQTTGYAFMTMGGIAVRREFLEQNPEAVAEFIADYAESIEFTNSAPAEAGVLIEKYGIAAAAVAENTIPRCNIVWLYGEEYKTVLKNFLTVLFEANPNFVGGKLPAEDFYG